MAYLPIVPEQLKYPHYWGSNAEHLAEQGCYEWMAGLLAPLQPKKILDIGCGTGEGLLALLKAYSPSITSIEENAECIRLASERVRAAGRSPAHVFRHSYEMQSDGRHGVFVDQSPIGIRGDPFLVQGDVILNDSALLEFVLDQAPFDAVTVWLIGAYQFRQTCLNLAPLQITDGNQYRLTVQNRVYEIAGKVLRPGGWLHVVDRGEAPREKFLIDDLYNAHREQASPTDLDVFDVSYREYSEPTQRGVSMQLNPGSSGRVPKNWDLAMLSILSRRPL